TALALGGVFPPPAGRSLVFTWSTSPRAGFAPDGNVSLVVQLVVGNVVFADVVPHGFEAHLREGIGLEHAFGLVRDVPTYQGHIGSRGALITPLTSHPPTESCQNPLEGLDLADPTAFAVAVLVEAEEPLFAHEVLEGDEV